jgi:glycosyltransferase involved in cell wall biosynthesis
MSAADPEFVSVVIPTRDRPHLLVRAVESALVQTYAHLEVVIVFDGPQPDALRAIDLIADTRIRTVTLPQSLGLASALNAGVRDARGRWVALLDDDDVWAPEKLSAQIETARASTFPRPIVATRVLARAGAGDRIWPRRTIRPGESMAHYLFVRRTPFGGESLILPSAMMFPRDLAASCPFRDGLRFHVDVDWLLRVATVPGVGVEFVPAPVPLVIWNIDDGRARISNALGWRESLRWIQEHRDLVTGDAYSSFVLTWVGARARRAGQWRAFGVLAADAFRHGRPSVNDLVTYAALWLLPPAFVDRAATGYERLWRAARREAPVR